MPSCKAGGAVKSRVIQRGGNMVLRSGTTTQTRGTKRIQSGQVLPNNPNSNNTYPFFVRVLKAVESNEKI